MTAPSNVSAVSVANSTKHTDNRRRASEKQINMLPNFKATVADDDGSEYTLHFAALFSKSPSAVPVIGIHGWPGSFLEFLPMMHKLSKQYELDPENLPFHFINPSVLGYCYSGNTPLDKNWTTADTARLCHKLMLDLGFTSYLSTGGDVGSTVARILAGIYDECKGALMNFCNVPPPDDFDESTLDETYRTSLKRRDDFFERGSAYAMEHGTKTSTIGHVLTSSPLALLAWVGEKFLAWSDEDPPLDDILESVTLWWLTETGARGLYPYRGKFDGTDKGMTARDCYVSKPMGFLWFPKEIIAVPESWIAQTGDLTFFRRHESGGHFAAYEKPDEMIRGISDFVKHVVEEKGVEFVQKRENERVS